MGNGFNSQTLRFPQRHLVIFVGPEKLWCNSFQLKAVLGLSLYFEAAWLAELGLQEGAMLGVGPIENALGPPWNVWMPQALYSTQKQWNPNFRGKYFLSIDQQIAIWSSCVNNLQSDMGVSACPVVNVSCIWSFYFFNQLKSFFCHLKVDYLWNLSAIWSCSPLFFFKAVLHSQL